MIQSLKREYQTVYTEKNKLKDFLRKREKDRKREEQEFSKKTTCQTNGYLQQNDCSTKKRQNIKRSYYESDSSNYDAESIEDNHRGYEK